MTRAREEWDDDKNATFYCTSLSIWIIFLKARMRRKGRQEAKKKDSEQLPKKRFTLHSKYLHPIKKAVIISLHFCCRQWIFMKTKNCCNKSGNFIWTSPYGAEASIALLAQKNVQFFSLAKRLSMVLQLLDSEIGFKCCFQMAFGVEFLAKIYQKCDRDYFLKGTSHSWPCIDNYRTSHTDEARFSLDLVVLCILIVARTFIAFNLNKLMGISYIPMHIHYFQCIL